MAARNRIASVLAGLAACLAGCGGGADGAGVAAARTPDAVVSSFYATRLRVESSGLPGGEALAKLGPHLSRGLMELVQSARAAQARFIEQRPDQKPPLGEGDLFSSLVEGPTGFEIAGTAFASGKARVRVHFTRPQADAPEGILRWYDEVLLLKEDDRWRIDDIVYHGDWDFASRGRLSGALRAAVALNSR
jgi:hypothetical protein